MVQLALDVLFDDDRDYGWLKHEHYVALGFSRGWVESPGEIRSAAKKILAEMICPVVHDAEDNWEMDTTYPPRL